jgi:6,7-dimethyl-8-ribityllumazine synthase
MQMPKTSIIRPRVAGKSALSFAIVASRYNDLYVQALVDSATAELSEVEPGANVHLVRVPGSFEIPLAVKLVAVQKKVDAILALGVLATACTPGSPFNTSSWPTPVAPPTKLPIPFGTGSLS